jgi:hypothetical protein
VVVTLLLLILPVTRLLGVLGVVLLFVFCPMPALLSLLAIVGRGLFLFFVR